MALQPHRAGRSIGGDDIDTPNVAARERLPAYLVTLLFVAVRVAATVVLVVATRGRLGLPLV
jgi:hypothetical protein